MRRGAQLMAVGALGLLAACQVAPPDQGGPTTAPQAASAPAPRPTAESRPLPEDLLAALEQLAAEDANARDEALTRLAEAIEKNSRDAALVRSIVGQLQQSIAAELAAMAGTTDPEARLRLAEVMDFNEALSRFAADAIGLPEPRRSALLAWGFAPEGAKLVAKVYSRRAEQRVAASSDLADLQGPCPEWLLAKLIDDPEREPALMAMDACFDRKPSDTLLEALWQKAVVNGMRNMGLRLPSSSKISSNSPQKVVSVHGRLVTIYPQDWAAAARQADGDVAADVLIAWESPLVEARLNRLFLELGDYRDPTNSYNSKYMILSPNYGSVGLSMMRLIDAYHPKEVVPFLMRCVVGDFRDGYSSTIGAQTYRYSSKIEAMGILIHLTDQDKGDYGLTRMPSYGSRWMLEGTEADEAAAVKKMQAWWKQNHKRYGYDKPDLPHDQGGRMGGYYGRFGG